MMGTGYFCKKYRIISNNMNADLGNLILLVSMPALIVYSMSTFTYSKAMLLEILSMLRISVALYLFYIGVSYLFPKVLRLHGERRDIVQFMTVFANTGFMGFPIAYIFFGSKGLFYIVILNMFYDVFVWTFGVSILGRPARRAGDAGVDGSIERDTNAKKKRPRFAWGQLKGLLNPCIVAVLVGFLIIVTGVTLPSPVTGFLDMLGKIATPLAMLFVGSMLADLKFAHIFSDLLILKAAFWKLILLPLMVFGILKLFHVSGHLLSIPVLATAMPAAASTPLLAGKYGNDSYLASKIVFMTTLLSVVTIPLLVSLL